MQQVVGVKPVSMDAVTQRQITRAQTTARQGTWRMRATWVVMLLTDMAALQLCVFAAYGLRLALSPIWPMEMAADQYSQLAFGVMMIPLAFQIMGFYPGYGMCPVKRLRLRVVTTAALFGLLIGWTLLEPFDAWAPGMLALAGTLALIVPWLLEAGMRDLLLRMGLWGEPVVVLGSGDPARDMIRTLMKRPETGFIPVAAFDDDPATRGRLIEGVRVEGAVLDAEEWARRGVGTAILAAPHLDGAGVARLTDSLTFETMVVMPDLAGAPSTWITPIDFEGTPGLAMRNQLRARHNRIIKRAMDFLVTVPAVLVSLPIIAVAALAIRIVDGGPVFFVHRRRGLNGRMIDVLKIRTMYKDADRRLEHLLATDPDAKAEWDKYLKLRNDPRVLPGVGTILRKFSLDELPQLFNVLKGDMTLVGPRPFPDYHMDLFTDEAFKKLRLSVLPGLTGYWQVSARSDGDLGVQQRLDTYYIRNWSIWLDIYILFRTVLIVVRGSGAY